MTREPEYPSPRITGSRRLTGPNLLHPSWGAVLDVTLDGDDAARADALLRAWHERVAALADALDWPDADTVERRYHGGASLFVHAPIDQLMTATEVCEAAWLFAESVADGVPAATRDVPLDALCAFAEAEALPSLRALTAAAAARDLNVTVDETSVFVGSGAGARGWLLDAISSVDAISWDEVRDIPIVLVTGSNGKTTVVRMVAAMARAEGHVVGYTCTDGVWIGATQVESGDWSGPVGARRVLQDPAVTLAVLETARGGILRRGLALQHAAVSAIVTLSADHLNDYGITDVAALAETKLVVARALAGHGTLVINADVPALADAVRHHTGRVRAVSIAENIVSTKAPRERKGAKASLPQKPHNLVQAEARTRDVSAPFRSSGAFSFCSEDSPPDADVSLTHEELATIPATQHGTIAHNTFNATIAWTIAQELGFGAQAKAALLRFGSDPRDNMGRMMVVRLADVTVVVDYAHNPQSVTALIEGSRGLPAVRRAITLGTGGDRDDVALTDIAGAAVASGMIDLYIAKEMPRFLRGRPEGSISGVLCEALRAHGAPASQVRSATSDMSATRLALSWAGPGDLLLLATHDERAAVLALLDELAQRGWRAGASLPV